MFECLALYGVSRGCWDKWRTFDRGFRSRGSGLVQCRVFVHLVICHIPFVSILYELLCSKTVKLKIFDSYRVNNKSKNIFLPLVTELRASRDIRSDIKEIFPSFSTEIEKESNCNLGRQRCKNSQTIAVFLNFCHIRRGTTRKRNNKE